MKWPQSKKCNEIFYFLLTRERKLLIPLDREATVVLGQRVYTHLAVIGQRVWFKRKVLSTNVILTCGNEEFLQMHL